MDSADGALLPLSARPRTCAHNSSSSSNNSNNNNNTRTHTPHERARADGAQLGTVLVLVGHWGACWMGFIADPAVSAIADYDVAVVRACVEGGC